MHRLIAVFFVLGACVEQGDLEPELGETGADGDGDGAGEGAAALEPECHPLDQAIDCDSPGACGECPVGEGCYPASGATVFACGPGGAGGFGGSCQHSAECQRGALCVATEVVPGCSAGYGCCTWFCEVGEGSCPAGTYCAGYFNGDAPVGFDTLGACVPKGA